MKRRGLFSFMAAAPVGIVGAIGAQASQTEKIEKPPKEGLRTISIYQDKNVGKPKDNKTVFLAETESHGRFTMYNHHFWVYNNKIDDWELVK